ncbi:D-alanyl-D-alanine carboxypeptidase [Bacillaceae bacterium Marseille-Q3522]|nr:D-alanyl-D-alanine carboxypeptidase [Bacillaceae bacterium Marseille-Q3522]
MTSAKKMFCITLITSLLFLLFPVSLKASVEVSAKSAILIEQGSGRILFEKDAFTPRRIASITKIMTAILAIESGKMDQKVKISKSAAIDGSSIYLQEGEEIKLEDLVYGLMLRSGNDAAVAIAEFVGGSVEGFVFLMNQKAAEIGMEHTHFANPHGLDDHEDHYSTAYDMAILTRYAMMNDTYKKISGTKTHRTPDPGEKWDRVWKNKNRLLTELYDYTTGGKTGYTKRAKRTLVTTATKNDLDLIAVTLNAPDDWNDHIQMYETAFQQFKNVKVLEKGSIKEVDHAIYKNKVYIKNPVFYPVLKKERELFKIEFTLQKPKRNWRNEENIPEKVGQAKIYFDKTLIKTVPIYFESDNEKQATGFFGEFQRIFQAFIGVGSYG